MKSPTFSIITPSYNQGQFIEETIKNVLSQEGDFYIDYIVMDGGSTDNSVEIIKNMSLSSHIGLLYVVNSFKNGNNSRYYNSHKGRYCRPYLNDKEYRKNAVSAWSETYCSRKQQTENRTAHKQGLTNITLLLQYLANYITILL